MKLFFKTIVFLTLFPLGQEALAHPVKVTSCRFAVESNKTRLVFGITDPAIYTVMATKEKIILDIKKATGSSGLVNNICHVMTKDNSIASMSSTQNGNNLHLILKLKEPVTLKHFLLSKPNRLVIDLLKTGSRGLVNSTRHGMTGEDSISREMVKENGEKENEIQPQIASNSASDKSEVDDILENMEQDLIRKMQGSNNADGDVKREEVITIEHARGSRDIIVVIDPGHGGKDPGAIGFNGTREKDVTLAVAKSLQSIINGSKGFRAILTRNSDYFIPLRGRLGIAHKHKADMFISVHADAYKNNTAHGASIFALSQRGATSEAARWLAEKENASELGQVISDKSALLRSVLIDLAQTATTGASLEIGGAALQGLATITSLHSKHVEQAAFVVLKSPDIPSLLVEVGFLSHSQEESKLRNSSYQEEIAEKLAIGIKSYFIRRPPPGTYLAQVKRKANYNLGMM